VEFRHSCVGEVLPTAHRISKVNAPTVSFIDIRQSSCDTAFCHDSVCLTEQGFTHEPNAEIACSGFNGSAKTRATGSDY
jgi:hypothetical protein